MNDAKFYVEMAQRYFRLAKLTPEPHEAAELVMVGRELIDRALALDPDIASQVPTAP